VKERERDGEFVCERDRKNERESERERERKSDMNIICLQNLALRLNKLERLS
jgi:hypothetical protein